MFYYKIHIMAYSFNYISSYQNGVSAWDAVTQEQLEELINEMGARCQAVIDADGKVTEY